jgi:hypothetical protein
MKRTPLKRIGKIGQANIEARKKIAEIAEERGLDYCELGLTGCLGKMYLAPAHKHKRAWYKGNAELLADPNEWVSACQNCHNLIEIDPKLTADVFEQLRPAKSVSPLPPLGE